VREGARASASDAERSPLSPSASPAARSGNIPLMAKGGVAIRDGFEGWRVLLPRETKTPLGQDLCDSFL